MTLLRSFVMAFTCFSRVPMPQVEWKPESMRYMMCFFPFIGIVISALVAVWIWLCHVLGLGEMLRGAGLTLIPLVVTGGIHLDGFADTVDAQASHAEPERKREILKDPHTGAFAIMGIAGYFIAYFACAVEFDPFFGWFLFMCVPFFSRCLSGIATIAFATATDEGMLASFHQSAHKRNSLIVLIVLACLAAAYFVFVGGLEGAGVIVVGLACLLFLYVFARRQFGGMSGDLAGFFLQIAELAMLAYIVIVFKIVVGM